MTLPLERYADLVSRIHDRIRLHIPPGSVVLVASKGDEDLVRLAAYRGWHFPQNDTGVYAGHYPANSKAAIAHLAHLRSCGAQYLVFPWTARWWLDHYSDLATHLNTVHRPVVVDEGVCVMFELRDVASADADGGEPSIESAATVAPAIRLVAPQPATPRRIVTILARFGVDQYPDAEREIDAIFERQLPEVDRTVIVVDNALPSDFVERRSNGALLGGNNSAREFSAFDRALDFIGHEVWSYDLVHFATSAFNTLYVAYLDRFDPTLLATMTPRAVCLGHLDCYNEPVDVLTFRSQHWVRSCFFFLPPAEVKALGRFAFVDASRFFSGDPQAPFLADAPLSPNYRAYITSWLAGEEIGQGMAWHSGFTIAPETLAAFEHKAASILNEHLLAVRLRALGCRLIDVTWLSTLLRQRGPRAIPWETSWREQLANREIDAVRPPDVGALTIV